MLPIKIAGTGSYLPARRVFSWELDERLGLAPGWVEARTGVAERRWAADESAVQMAAAACRMAIDEAGLPGEAIDLVIGASSAPHQMIPCTAALVQRELGLPDGGSGCFDVNATCVGFLVGLNTAAHLLVGGAARHVLLFSSEMAHLSLNPDEPESYGLMGDAAAAVVLSRREPGEASAYWHGELVTHGSAADLTVLLGGGSARHPNDPATTWQMNCFHMNGPAVFRVASRLLGPWVEGVLEKVGWRRDDVDIVVPHQASGRGVGLLVKRCGFRPEQMVLNLATRGNCVAASLPLALAEAAQAGRLRRGQRVLLLGTGAGLSLAAAALTY